MKNEDTYQTSDFKSAVVLRALGFSMIEILDRKTKRATFVFDDPNNMCEETLRRYWEYDLSADVRTVLDAQDELKTRLYS